ncbi:hypothetical protein ACFQQB_66050 [Nonomuraea rubra]|uniref:hypothetical protein n=1 Tax=Nonomuraea rubra TaxID=46180 RepID=UPI003385335C
MSSLVAPGLVPSATPGGTPPAVALRAMALPAVMVRLSWSGRPAPTPGPPWRPSLSSSRAAVTG